MVNFGPLVAEIGPVVWGTPANFNGFCILAALLERRCSTEANQTLHGVWSSPGLVHYIYIFGGCCPITEFCQVQNSLCYLQVLLSHILVVLLHGTWAVGASQTLRHWAQGATYIFVKATITLGIGPHSSYLQFDWLVATKPQTAAIVAIVSDVITISMSFAWKYSISCLTWLHTWCVF